MGHDVTYSGTVTAAMEAAIWGLPGIAFSIDSPENHLGFLDYGPAGQAAREIVAQVIRQDLPPSLILNVNIPYLPYDQIRGFQVTRLGLRVYRDQLDARRDPRGRPYYWIGGDAPTGVPDEGTDFGALADGFVSMTPLQLDLTAYQTMDLLRSWEWERSPVDKS
jgi:5'-nucleotidase